MKKANASSRKRSRLTQGLGLSTNNPHLVRLIHTHPEISIHLRGDPGLENEGNQNQAEFCELTKAAVLKYQQQKGLKPDGIVGIMTWRSMGHDPVLLSGLAQERRSGALEEHPGIDFSSPARIRISAGATPSVTIRFPRTMRERPIGGLAGDPGLGPRQRGGGLNGDPRPGPRPRPHC